MPTKILRDLSMQRNRYENFYCAGCGQTTKHENRERTTTCLRCGVVKDRIKNRKPDDYEKQKDFEHLY
jgi:DNA-directed RNA polymerase subunit RPC12/RpoP